MLKRIFSSHNLESLIFVFPWIYYQYCSCPFHREIIRLICLHFTLETGPRLGWLSAIVWTNGLIMADS